MKRMKLIKSLGAFTALAMPMATVLMGTTACGKKSYTELVSEMKDDCVSRLMTMCKTVHRNAWNEGEAVEYIKAQMGGLGYHEPSGSDTWSTLRAVKNFRDPEIPILKDKYKEPGTDKEYGNLWYDIPATEGFEDVPGVIIHTHIDSSMDFAGLDDAEQTKNHINWSQNGCDVNYDRENELLSSESSTMSIGADGALGIATLLTIAKYNHRFNHGPLKLLFAVGESEPIAPYTKDGITYPEYSAGFDLLKYDQIDDGTPNTVPKGEERGVTYTHTGNRPFGENWEYKYIISATGIKKDSICISSSGVHECQIDASTEKSSVLTLNDTDAWRQGDNQKGNKIRWDETVKLPWSTGDEQKRLMTVKISGLQGGTTSTYIDKGQGSALVMLANVLFSGDTSLQLISMHSTPVSGYSISREASATFATFYDVDTWNAKIELEKPIFQGLYPNEDWQNVKFEVIETPHEQAAAPYHGISKQASRDLLSMLSKQLYFGPISWFPSGEVKTSENIGPCEITINDKQGGGATATFDLRVILRSSDTFALSLFKHLTHSIFKDGLSVLFNCQTDEQWSEEIEKQHIFHIEDPAWEPATEEKPNKLQPAFEEAFKNFGIRYNLNNEHGWIEVSCASKIFEEKGLLPHMVLIGGQVDNNHSPQETLQTDSITTLLETIVYVLDNSKSTLPKV